MEAETSAEALGIEKCTRLCATSAGKTAKFLLGPVGISQYTAATALRARAAAEGRVEAALEGLILEKGTIPINSYWSRLAH